MKNTHQHSDHRIHTSDTCLIGTVSAIWGRNPLSIYLEIFSQVRRYGLATLQKLLSQLVVKEVCPQVLQVQVSSLEQVYQYKRGIQVLSLVSQVIWPSLGMPWQP